jgi:signal transduction histidine kinase
VLSATQALTIVAEIDPARRVVLEHRLAAIATDLEGNTVFRPGSLPDTHFTRFVIIDDDAPAPHTQAPLLGWESNPDGREADYLEQVVRVSPELDRVHEACVAGQIATLSALERADREDAFAEWLAAHGADPAAAAALVDTALGMAMLDQLAATIDGSHLNTAIRWLASRCTARALASDIERATTRISTLVGAVKRFAYMDRALTPERVPIAESVGDTVVLLQEKIRQKSITVGVDIAADVPPARAIGGDLNQVLMHVIDNALDASPASGLVTVSAARAHDRVVIRIIDNGPGVPVEIRDRMFDPFITSKPVGQGTGLGLDIARQLVRRNEGDIECDSAPGRTEFRIVLHVYALGRAELPEARR